MFAAAKGDPYSLSSVGADHVPSGPEVAGHRSIKFERLSVDMTDSDRVSTSASGRLPQRGEGSLISVAQGIRLGLAITGQLGGSNIREAEEIDPRRELLEERINRLTITAGVRNMRAGP